MTSRGRPKLDSREWIESGEGDVPLTAKLTSPPRDISEVTSTEMYALPRGALDDATGRATSDGAFAYVVLASRQVVLATRDTVKPTVELEDPKSWSVASRNWAGRREFSRVGSSFCSARARARRQRCGRTKVLRHRRVLSDSQDSWIPGLLDSPDSKAPQTPRTL